MFYLHISNRTENLLRHLAEVIKAGGRRSPFEKEVFLIQSQGMERMISQAMAVQFRSWCNFHYLLPLDFLTDIAGRLGMPLTPDSYDRGILAWRIEGLLRNLDGAVYRPLQGYMHGENAGLKRFQLSCRLANLFDQYQIGRSDMLALWDAGERATDHSSEAWQMALWQRLKEGAEGMPHRGILLRQVIEKLSDSDDLSGLLPRRISVFGLHIMPPLFLQYLQALACHCDVHLYLLSPCRHYWGDIVSKRRTIQKHLDRIERGHAAEAEAEARDRHPLLESLGRQGREFQEMLLKNVDFEIEFKSFEDPLNDSAPTVLHQLQSDLLQDNVRGRGQDDMPADDSLAVVSCHSRLREIEILKDHILHRLHKDPALELRDIIVMAPDIQEYAPLIPAVFDDIQHSIADRSLRKRNRVIGAFMAFLEIFAGRFSWIDILDLLKKEEVYPNFELTAADLDILQHWITSSGIRWGLSAGQRKEMGLPDFSENTWSTGLNRLLMGYAIDTDQFVDGILPFTEIEGGQAGDLGGLCRFIEIIERAADDFGVDRKLTDWSALLAGYAVLLFGDAENEEILELRDILLQLGGVGSTFHHHPVDIQVIRAWLERSAQESRASSGFLRGCLTFCSMLPMRSIPFRMVCLLGLNEGEFPRNDRYATFDLIAPPRLRPGDRSSRADDRYLFLEALLDARDTLYLSFIGRSIISNEAIPPSVVVTELLELLHGAYGIKDLVVEHPLHPFSHRYFSTETKRLFSYNRHYCDTAIGFRRKKEDVKPWWSGDLAPVDHHVSVADLLGFFANPQRWFVKNRLGINLDPAPELPEDRETFALGGLNQYQLDQEIIGNCLDGKAPELVLERLNAEGRWALGSPGRSAFAGRYRVLKEFAGQIRATGMGDRLPDRIIDCEAGKLRITGVLSNIYENGILLARYADLKGKDVLAGWIHHLLMGTLPGCIHSTVILARDRSLRFSGSSNAGPDLERLMAIYTEGSRQPSPLFVEPAFAYVQQLHASRPVEAAIVKARKHFLNSLEKGFELEWGLLFRNTPTDLLLDERFEALCRNFFNPIWSVAHAG
jgi:exodeoxyribonuclease V gamma subunit